MASERSFAIVYVLAEHPLLGCLPDVWAVQQDRLGRLMLRHQSVSAQNLKDFDAITDANDKTLVDLIEQIRPEALVRRFGPRKAAALEFVDKVFDARKGDPKLQDAILQFIESRRAIIVPLLAQTSKKTYQAQGGELSNPLKFMPEKSSVRFHFKRDDEQTIYYPTILYAGKLLYLFNTQSLILSNKPAYIMLNGQIYSFIKNMEAAKLKPFVYRRNICIPRKLEDQYYQKFVAPLVAAFDVKASGFVIEDHHLPLTKKLYFGLARSITSVQSSLDFIDSKTSDDGFEATAQLASPETAAKIAQEFIFFKPYFDYGKHRFEQSGQPISVVIDRQEDEYTFHKIHRNPDSEQHMLATLAQTGMNGSLPREQALQALASHSVYLKNAGIEIVQEDDDQIRFFTGSIVSKLRLESRPDWLDLQGCIYFGDQPVYLYQIREALLAGQQTLRLPNGQIAILPTEWLEIYRELVLASQTNKENNEVSLSMYHLPLAANAIENGIVQLSTDDALAQKLKDFEQITDVELPQNLQATLRPYQKSGYDWLMFLNKFGFGGCLADDMGLGKTLQTLALLLKNKQNSSIEGIVKPVCLLIMPTSLLYNWQIEADRFAPDLRLYIYAGTQRAKNIHQYFDNYDLILTTYATARLDIKLLRSYNFDYLILDEAQAIKNPDSAIAASLVQIIAKNRLALTGTPIENSLADIWSIMNFLNPGLLGTKTSFKKYYQTPIEKQADNLKLDKLYQIINPFILRRLKSQVAAELPAKTELVSYCQMNQEQEKKYLDTQNLYKLQILESIETYGMGRSRFLLLKALIHLRQIANHPAMSEPGWVGGSGKMSQIVYTLENILAENHKVLIFSQFVRHLNIIRAYLDEKNIDYAYIDGATKDRQAQVKKFQQGSTTPLFLISLKAGGTGLNLTAADYVFLLDPWWNPAVEAQAIDRAHRIGQDKKVFVYKFITKETVEEKILALQQSKRFLADALIRPDDGFVKNLSQADIINIFSDNVE